MIKLLYISFVFLFSCKQENYKEKSTKTDNIIIVDTPTKKEKIISDYKKTGKINNLEIIYKIKYYDFNNNLPEYLTFYIKEKEEKNEVFNIETNGAYIGKIEYLTIDSNHLIHIRLDETSGIQYGVFYSIDIINKKAKKVIEDFGNYKIPDSLEIYKGFGILKDVENKFHSGLRLRSLTNGNRYLLTKTHKLVLNENNEFVLKVIENKITEGQY